MGCGVDQLLHGKVLLINGGTQGMQQQTHGAGDDWQQHAAATLPMGTLGQVDELAGFVVLLSDRSGVVTGSLINWDQNVIGGLG